MRCYGESDQRVFEVPCPSCGTYSEIMWPEIEWPAERPELAAWRCPDCEELVDHRHKPGMVREGRWRAD
jgi:phage terminase large subunit GpA-like protein